MGEINQASFIGGMNLLADDTRPTASVEGDIAEGRYRIASNQYRIGFNVRCRYDVLDPILSSKIDVAAPPGIKQALVTFGNYLILFVAGKAYYRLNTVTGWTQIPGFSMHPSVPRYWTVAVPVSTTNYGRLSIPAATGSNVGNSRAGINAVNIGASFGGTVPGLLVQDGVNQPQFIFLDINNNNTVTTRTTQTFAEWQFVINSTTFSVTTDNREYVPIGTYMEWYNGILFIVAPDLENIYRSVSGRPLDFVVNVKPDGTKGGDATTTSYSVGIGGITCLKQVSGALFVSCANIACFSVTLNTNQTAPTEWGEYTFVKTFLFTAGCLTDRGIVDIIGDTTFIDVSGLRSFNSIQQEQNEGRNSVFSKTVSSLFTNITQEPLLCSAAVFDNYSVYCVNTIYGFSLIVYDTLSEVFSSIDIAQIPNNVAITQFALVATEVTQLYGITSDNRVVQLYAGPNFDLGIVRLMSICSQDPSKEMKQTEVRCILSQFIKDSTITLQSFVNNRLSYGPVTKNITYIAPVTPYTGTPTYIDVDTQVNNLLFTTPDIGQGWKTWNVLSWTGGGRITNIKTSWTDETPMQPLLTQGNTK